MILKYKEHQIQNDVQFVWVSQGNRPVISFHTEDEAVAWKTKRDAKIPEAKLPTLRLIKRVVQYEELAA